MGKENINDINDINDCFLKENINEVNDINDRKSTYKITYTEYVADKLVETFNAPRSRRFFLKCAWNLSENTIWSAVEDSRKKAVKSPIALFIFLCNKELRKLPIK